METEPKRKTRKTRAPRVRRARRRLHKPKSSGVILETYLIEDEYEKDRDITSNITQVCFSGYFMG